MHGVDRELGPGATFEGRYEIVTRLGAGGFGAVYKARQLTTGQFVALKMMHADGSASGSRAARFLREAKLSAKLHHPNIVQLVDSGQTNDGRLYTVFAFVPGENLADLLAREGAMAPRQAWHLMTQVLDALACAHAQGIVHRDLKPSNIMVVSTGARRNAMLLDLGISAILHTGAAPDVTPLTLSNDVLGTPGYGAPEQWRGQEPTPSADLYSWSLVFLECLTGQPVYRGGTPAEIFFQQLGPEPVPIPAALEILPIAGVVRRAAEKDVTARAVSAKELLDALEDCDPRALSLAVLEREESLAGAAASVPIVSTVAHAAYSEVPVAERRQLTAVCCNFGVTSEEKLDVERRDERLRDAIAAAIDVVRAHRGHVAAALGNQLLAYFGHPLSEEDDAMRATRAALQVASVFGEQRAVGEVEVSVGVHTGLVVSGRVRGGSSLALVLGETPRIATRLAAAAPAGRVLTTAATRQLLRASFDITAHEKLALDPKNEPADTYQIIGERADRFVSEPPSIGGSMVGRKHEIELLLERWRRVRLGGGQSILIAGEPGIGKSRLSRELRDRIAGEEHFFVEGRCSPDTRHNALFPIALMLQRVLGQDRGDGPEWARARLEAELRGYGFNLAENVPLFLSLFSLPIAPPYVAPDISPQRLKNLTFNAVILLLLAMSERKPVLLLLEDLHWADPTTLEFLEKLVRESSAGPICILMTSRPEFSPAFAGGGMLQLPLTRLERSDVSAMISEIAGSKRLPQSLVEQVVTRTDGIPLFVEELTRMMLDSEALVEHEDRYELSGNLAALEIPGSLRALLTARLDRLERARETAQVAAALGREFSIDVLSSVSQLGPVAVQEDLDRLAGAGLVLRRPRVQDSLGVFKHALIRDAAYESLSRSARQAVHLRIADVLVEQFPELSRARPDLLALHYSAADRTDKALGYAQQAARHALERSAYQEAITHASSVVDWVGALPAGEAVEAALGANGVLAQAMMATRGWADPQVKSIADRSRALLHQVDSFSPQKVPTLWSLFAYHHTASHRAAARTVAEELLGVADESGDQGLRAAANTILAIALYPEGKVREAKAALERAIELYDPEKNRDHGERMGLDSLVLAKTLQAQLKWLAGDESAFELVSSALRWAREVGHVPSIAIGLLYGCQVHQYAGDRETTAVMTGEILALADKYGLPAYEGYAAVIHSWATGEEQNADAILGVLARMGCRLLLSYYSSLVADTLARRGALDLAIERIDECLRLCAENGEPFYEPELRRRRAVYELSRGGATEGVRSSLERAARQAGAQDMPRIEVLAIRDLLRHFGADAEQEARLRELTELYPALRKLDQGAIQ